MRPRIRQGADFRVPKGAARVVERQVAAGPAAGSAYDRAQHPGASRSNPGPHATELQRADPDLQHMVGLGERSAAPPGSEPCLPGKRSHQRISITSAAKAGLDVPGTFLDLFWQESLATER